MQRRRWSDHRSISSIHPDDVAPASEQLATADDEAVRKVLTDYLHALGLGLLEATHGSATLALLDRRRPDLLLVDFAMPVMNGAELAQAARGRWPGLLVIFATAYAEGDAVEAAVGPDALMLRKPFTLHELGVTLEGGTWDPLLSWRRSQLGRSCSNWTYCWNCSTIDRRAAAQL